MSRTLIRLCLQAYDHMANPVVLQSLLFILVLGEFKAIGGFGIVPRSSLPLFLAVEGVLMGVLLPLAALGRAIEKSNSLWSLRIVGTALGVYAMFAVWLWLVFGGWL